MYMYTMCVYKYVIYNVYKYVYKFTYFRVRLLKGYGISDILKVISLFRI